MNIITNYLKNIGFLIFLMVSEIAAFQIAHYFFNADEGHPIWLRGHPYHNLAVILMGALLYSMYDWWQRKSASEQHE